MNRSSSSRIMAIDLGDKRIGIALSDPSWTIASGFGVIKRSSRQSDFDKIGHIAGENNVFCIIVGLPTLPSGEEGTRAAWARDYASSLADALGIQVKLWDESLTTVDAEASMRAGVTVRIGVEKGLTRWLLRSSFNHILNPTVLKIHL